MALLNYTLSRLPLSSSSSPFDPFMVTELVRELGDDITNAEAVMRTFDSLYKPFSFFKGATK
jgi:hypothetical protein